MLAASGITVRRGGSAILDCVGLIVAPGEIVAVLGPNGAGKSTLLSALAGDMTADSGTVMLDGAALAAMPAEDRALRVAVLPQQSRLEFGFTVREVVSLGRYPHRRRETQGEHHRAVEASLAWAGLMHLAARDYTTLSGGEQQRCHLARVYAQIALGDGPARYLLLDEPVSNLDLRHQIECLDGLKRLASAGLGILCILHDLNLAALYADRLYVMQGGRVARSGDPAEVLSPESVQQDFAVAMLLAPHPQAPSAPQFLHRAVG